MSKGKKRPLIASVLLGVGAIFVYASSLVLYGASIFVRASESSDSLVSARAIAYTTLLSLVSVPVMSMLL